MNRPPHPSLRPALLAVAFTAVVSMWAVAAQEPSVGDAPATQPVVTASGLKILDQGRNDLAAQDGDFVTVHYTGRLENGTVFDSSLTNGREPFSLQIGITSVIKGWTEGLVGMRPGDRRQLVIPPDLGYGALGSPPRIPPNATLIFDVEMLYVRRANAPAMP